MRKFAFALLAGVVGIIPAVQSNAASLIDFVGYSWETGGFPDSNPGDVLELVAVVDGLTSPLSWAPGVNEYTLNLGGLISLGTEQPDVMNIVVQYDSGQLGLYEDDLAGGTNAAPGVNPPNTTAPGYYTDGTNYLAGELQEFTIFYNTQFNSGAFEANIAFNGGDHLSELGAQTTGYTFGGVFIFGTPEGYDLQWDGQILLDPVAVQPATWGGVKAAFK